MLEVAILVFLKVDPKKRDAAYFNQPGGPKKDSHLTIMVRVDTNGVRQVESSCVLMDTGAEVCPIEQGHLPGSFFQSAEISSRQIGVNKEMLAVGDKKELFTMANDMCVPNCLYFTDESEYNVFLLRIVSIPRG